jgi:hypothetical protein
MEEVTNARLSRASASCKPSANFRRLNELYKAPGASVSIDQDHLQLSPSPWKPRGWTYNRESKRHPQHIRDMFKSSTLTSGVPALSYETTSKAHFTPAKANSYDLDQISASRTSNFSPFPVGLPKYLDNSQPLPRKYREIYKPSPRYNLPTLAGLLDTTEVPKPSKMWAGLPVDVSQSSFRKRRNMDVLWREDFLSHNYR